MDIVLTTEGGTPFYRQIFDQLSSKILTGELSGGEALPPIRTVASELRISVITVKKAWEELDRAGLIVTIAGKGCFVSERHTTELADKRDAIAMGELKNAVDRCKSLGLSLDEITAKVRELY